uniref:Uncharacterized protein n=1 Tax=Picea glauca TaxID=3330 RepID=A0A101LZ22_PICGL|nr:hypothetical protein ABT39_MTgene4975 [Picea glauca]
MGMIYRIHGNIHPAQFDFVPSQKGGQGSTSIQKGQPSAISFGERDGSPIRDGFTKMDSSFSLRITLTV